MINYRRSRGFFVNIGQSKNDLIGKIQTNLSNFSILSKRLWWSTVSKAAPGSYRRRTDIRTGLKCWPRVLKKSKPLTRSRPTPCPVHSIPATLLQTVSPTITYHPHSKRLNWHLCSRNPPSLWSKWKTVIWSCFSSSHQRPLNEWFWSKLLTSCQETSSLTGGELSWFQSNLSRCLFTVSR